MPTSKKFLFSGPDICTIERGVGFIRKMNHPFYDLLETGSFKIMQHHLFKILTMIFVLLTLCSSRVSAQTIYQESFSTHHRWNIKIPREQVLVKKDDNEIKIQTLNIELFNKLADDLSKVSLDKGYFSDLKFNREQYPQEPATVSFILSNPNIEMFSFYQDKDKKYILDFWKNEEVSFDEPIKKKEVQKPLLAKITKPVKANKKDSKKQEKKINYNKELSENKNPLSSIIATKKVESKGYRDFRYGASFIWDYRPLRPTLEQDVNLKSKIPASLYKIKDREYDKDEKEAHMQLTINLFRKEKWGLLAKSVKLYETKFGKDSNHELNEFLKANSLLKKNLKEQNKGVAASAYNILNNLLETSTNYELKKAIGRYLIQASLDRDNYIESLSFARKLFFESKEEFDKEMTIYSSRVILHCLASLKQNDKINEFLEDKYIKKILPQQIGHSYSSFALLEVGDTEKVIELYESRKKGLVGIIEPAILFNTAEAYFRNSQYEKSITLFDSFVKEYSYLNKAPHARLRIALSYEVLEKPIKKVVKLYKDALDRSPDDQIRYEAKLRYLGVELLRKQELAKTDLEKEIFFEMSPGERKSVSKELKKLLWLVRLRTYINKKQYSKGLTYLSSIPLNSLKPLRRQVFQADGAEIIYGLINEAHAKENFSKAIKLWKTYHDIYDNKVAINPHINFLVADSYLKLGLVKSFDETLENFQGLKSYATRVFPAWIKRNKDIQITNMLKELILIRHLNKKQWDLASTMLEKLNNEDKKEINYSYYRGIVDFEQNKHKQAADSFENMLIDPNAKNQLDMAQLANLITKYVESLHKTSQTERLVKTVKAIIKDLDREEVKLESLKNAKKRIHYLLIENLYASKQENYPQLEENAQSFLNNYKKSEYADRVKYIYGLAMIKNLKVEQGSEVLNSMISDKDVPGYLKEMAKTELSAIKLGVGI